MRILTTILQLDQIRSTKSPLNKVNSQLIQNSPEFGQKKAITYVNSQLI